MTGFDERLRALPPEVLRGLRRGIEKESLRVRPDGMLADTAHPPGLGSALAHPRITTDFSESQLELITGVHADIDSCLEELAEIHQVVYRNLGEELLWCASMPCGLPSDEAIPIARYGSSNLGTAKSVYRIGLSHRYGRRMQTICGVHYNFSLPPQAWPLLQAADRRTGPAQAYQNEAYFSLIRNFRRHSWLLLYLIGASPAVCRSFVAGREHRLQELSAGTLYLPLGTSLRMGPLGYQSDAQASLSVSYNSLKSYATSLNGALTVPYPAYETIGVGGNGNYRQLATSLLQIENEFYGTIRPKPRFRSGSRPLRLLGESGVDYVEVRCVDNDPFSPVGITAATMRLLDVFLLHCLLSDSPPDTAEEIAANSRNQHRVAENGRDRELRLALPAGERGLSEWGNTLMRECEPIAAALDAAHRCGAYRDALSAAQSALADPSRTPSAHVLRELRDGHGDSYAGFVLERSARYRRSLLDAPLAESTVSRYAQIARESIDAQRRIEAADSVPFETYRRQYLSQDLLGGIFLKPGA